MSRVDPVTGITGQDGSYLAVSLLNKGYRVFGLVRRRSTVNFERLVHLQDRIELIPGDILDQNSLVRALKQCPPHEVYNLAAQSLVPTSWNQPVLTGEFTALGVTHILEAVHLVEPHDRFYQASSSEMFGMVRESPQNEDTPFYPRNPYGVAKLYGHRITVDYLESYDLFAVSGILFNHESPRRGIEFVIRKVTHGATRIKLGLQEELKMGNLDSERDWGYAADYVEAMWVMFQQERPRDYVTATRIPHTVRRLLEVAFRCVCLDYRDHVEIDPLHLRPAEVHYLRGDYFRAERELGWRPKVNSEELITLMVNEDLARLRNASTAPSKMETAR